MTLTDPNLILAFDDSQIMDSEQVVMSQYLVKDSIKLRCQLLDGLMSSSNQVTLQLTRDCPSTTDIIKTCPCKPQRWGSDSVYRIPFYQPQLVSYRAWRTGFQHHFGE